MATETLLSDHHSPDKTMEKVFEETQTVKLEDVDPPKEVGGKDEEEKLDADGLAGSETPVNKLEETTGMQTKLPTAVEVKKVDDAPVVDVHVEADSEKIENCALNPESLSASGMGDGAVETQSGDPEKCIVVEKVENPSLVDVPAEVDLKVVENSVLDPESDSASKPGETPEEHSVDVLKVDDGPIVDIPTETGSKVVENSVLEPEPSSASEPGGENFERQLEAPKGDTTEVEKVDVVSVADVLVEAGPKVVENSVLEPESSPSEPIGVAAERLSEEHPTVVEKVDDATIVDVPCEASLEVVENSVPEPESSPSEPIGVAAERLSEEHPTVVEKVDDATIVDVPCEASLEVVENSVLEPESSPSEPIGVAAEKLSEEHPTVVEKVDDAAIVDVLCEASLEVVENSVLEPESSPSEPIGVAAERLSEEHPTVVEKVDDATIVDVPCEASLEVVENSVLDPESSSASKPGDEMVESQREALEEHPVEVEKVDNIPIVDFPAEAGVKTIENSFVDAESSSPSEPGGATVQRQLEATNEHSTTEMVETQQQEQVAGEAIEQPEEKPSVGTAKPDSSIEAVDKLVEHLEVIPVKESELEVAKVPEAFSEAECKIAESPGLVTTVEGETGERAEVIKGVEGETEEIKPSESLGGEVMTSEGTMADKCEGNESLKEETSLDQEPVAYENSVPTNEEAQVDPKEEEGDSSTFDVIEKAAARATDKEGGGGDVVERLSKDETVVAAKVEEEKEEKIVKIEDSEGTNTKVEESIQTETAKTYDRNGSNFVAEVAEIDREQVSRDVEEVAEVKKLENVEEDIPLSVEADKKNVKIEDSEGKNTKVEESIQTETAKTDDRNGSNFVAEVAEIDREQVSRDVEEVAEVKKLENVEEDIPLSVEADKKSVKIEDSEGKNTKVEESIQTETAKTYDRNGSNFVAEVAEIDREQVSRDVEVVAEVKKLENVEEDIPLSVEADKDKDGEGKLSEVDAKETVKTNADNLESAKTDGEIAKSNPPNLETLKNGDDSKTSAKPPKQDDSVKKHSNNLISKVKQSIVKVKKAITGKSPSPKALLPEAKGDEKVK